MAWVGGNREGHPPPPGDSQNYQVSLPKCLLRLRCPVEGCLGGASSRINLRVHLTNRHVRDKIVILEEGNQPYPRCPKCDMFVPHKSLNGRNPATDFCRMGGGSKRRRLEEEEAQAGTEMVITAYGILLAPSTSFKYLGRFLLSEDGKWPAVVHNLWRKRQNWARLSRVLSREGADARTSGIIYMRSVITHVYNPYSMTI